MSKRVVVSNVIEGSIAVTAEKGQLLYNELEKNIKNNEISILDFSNISDLISAFSNVAIGKLYDIATPEELNRLVKVDPQTLHPTDRKTIERSLKNSKKKREQSQEFQRRLGENLDNGVEL